MNFLNRHLIKTGTKMFTRRLLSRPPIILPNPNARNNIGTSSKYSTPRAFTYYTVIGGSMLFGSSIILSYAKYDLEFRERLKNKSELIDKIIQFLWRENKNENEGDDEDKGEGKHEGKGED